MGPSREEEINKGSEGAARELGKWSQREKYHNILKVIEEKESC